MISVIIVTYNSEKQIKKCLESVHENISSKDEVFVIDNNSVDKTVDQIKKIKKSNLHLIKNDYNLGFSRGVNQGLKQARGEYIFLINPDTEFKKSIFSKLIIFVERDKKIGIVGVRQLNSQGKSVGSFGNFPGPFSDFIQKTKLHKILPFGHWLEYNFLTQHLFNKNRKVGWVGAGFMLIKKEVFNQIGLFDEFFFMYYEDVDFCKRASDAGFEVWYLGKIKVKHLTGASSGDRNKIREMSQKSLAYYKEKYSNQ